MMPHSSLKMWNCLFGVEWKVVLSKRNELLLGCLFCGTRAKQRSNFIWITQKIASEISFIISFFTVSFNDGPEFLKGNPFPNVKTFKSLKIVFKEFN